jgi:hypothetical protein
MKRKQPTKKFTTTKRGKGKTAKKAEVSVLFSASILMRS